MGAIADFIVALIFNLVLFPSGVASSSAGLLDIPLVMFVSFRTWIDRY